MNVIPAIDLRHGRCVRLLRGEKGSENVYFEDPVTAALHWESEGAALLHLVDLDAAFGETAQKRLVETIVRSVRVPIQVGGGIRTVADFRRLRDSGVSRVVFGTVAVESPEVVDEALAEGGEAVVVAVDVKGGQVAVRGWTENGGRDPIELGRCWASCGVSRFLYTEISRDGAMDGIELDSTEAFARGVNRPVIASGGIGTLDHLRRLKTLSGAGVDGVIVGKALYERVFTLGQARRALMEA